ncbi:hypothetical protein HMPREF1548_05582 [Clostridium sp. KLE 1755]|nr:hypothetical protein HMPREF1548_05582 [Clostridium sp. KLE 1755]
MPWFSENYRKIRAFFRLRREERGEGMDKVSRRQKLCRRASDKSYEIFETGCEEKMTAIK